MSGFAIFSVLGYMSQKQGVDIATVAESGMDVSLKSISVWLFFTSSIVQKLKTD